MATSLSISLSHTASLYISKTHTKSIDDNGESFHRYQTLTQSSTAALDLTAVNAGTNNIIFIKNVDATESVRFGPMDSATDAQFLIELAPGQTTVFRINDASTLYARPSGTADMKIEIIGIGVS